MKVVAMAICDWGPERHTVVTSVGRIDPVTGCVMKKVEHTGVHVIKIRKEKISEDEDE